MKKRLFCLLLAFMPVLSTGCAVTEPVAGSPSTGPDLTTSTAPLPTSPKVPKSLKILAVGNSFAINATRHLCQIAKNLGAKDVTVGILYRGSCSLEMHRQYALNGEKAYHYYKTTTGEFDITEGVDFQTCLNDEDWDVITFQQNSDFSGVPSSYNASIDKLVEIVQAAHPNAKRYWHMTWTYAPGCPYGPFTSTYHADVENMFRLISSAVEKKILPRTDFEGIIPAGTMIHWLRSTAFASQLQVSDGVHLNTAGEYAAAVVWYCTLFGGSVEKLTYCPDVLANTGLLEKVKELASAVMADPLGKAAPVFPAAGDVATEG